jgi:catechol 2,3-dioxygenase-like lactoylglutathione lyase family enzyme
MTGNIDGIHHVNIRAPAGDIAKLRHFYCDVLGFRDGWRPPFQSRGHWLYAGTLPVVHLVENDADGATNATAGVVDHIAFRCTDLAPVIEKLRSRDIAFRVTRVPSLGDQQLIFHDPLGMGIELNVGGPV